MERLSGGTWRLVVASIAASAVALTGCSGRSAGSPSAFNPGGPMEVHGSASGEPTSEPSGPRVRVAVPDVKGEPWEDAAHAVLGAGFEFGNVVAVADGHPRWSVIAQSPDPGSRLVAGGAVSLTLSMGPHPPESVHQLACRPEEDELDEPYCIGKLIKY